MYVGGVHRRQPLQRGALPILFECEVLFSAAFRSSGLVLNPGGNTWIMATKSKHACLQHFGSQVCELAKISDSQTAEQMFICLSVSNFGCT